MNSLVLRALLSLLCSSAAFANAKSILIEDGRSPDGLVELSIEPSGSEGVAAGTALIQEVETGNVLGKFDWAGFGAKADSTAFEVFWRSDCRYFAIKWAEARGWMTGAIYGRLRNGRWIEVKTPRDEYTETIKKMGEVAELYGKGCESPVEWLPNGDLLLEFVDRNLCYDHEDLEKEFKVVLRVADQKRLPLNAAKIVSIKQRPRAETEQRLREQFSTH